MTAFRHAPEEAGAERAPTTAQRRDRRGRPRVPEPAARAARLAAPEVAAWPRSARRPTRSTMTCATCCRRRGCCRTPLAAQRRRAHAPWRRPSSAPSTARRGWRATPSSTCATSRRRSLADDRPGRPGRRGRHGSCGRRGRAIPTSCAALDQRGRRATSSAGRPRPITVFVNLGRNALRGRRDHGDRARRANGGYSAGRRRATTAPACRKRPAQIFRPFAWPAAARRRGPRPRHRPRPGARPRRRHHARRGPSTSARATTFRCR